MKSQPSFGQFSALSVAYTRHGSSVFAPPSMHHPSWRELTWNGSLCDIRIHNSCNGDQTLDL